ncbi:MAG TPA: hypothetical protein VGC25_11595, partial [Alphaproteobacteria bacterium]
PKRPTRQGTMKPARTMPVEDHPKWPEWKGALERLLAANDHRKLVKDLPQRSAERAAAETEYQRALAAYHKIADEI